MKKRRLHMMLAWLLFVAAAATGCRSSHGGAVPAPGNVYAAYFEILPGAVVSRSPEGQWADTLRLAGPLSRLVCMSSSHVGYLDAIGALDRVCAVSGAGFITSPALRSRAVPDIGYDPDIDYEKILSLSPDLVLTYSVGAQVPDYVGRLRSLGVDVLVLSEHLEDHPLARGEYVRLFGALAGKQAKADSVFAAVSGRYDRIRREAARRRGPSPVPVLLNVPYAEAWYIPGGGSYMTTLVRDAGGEVLGAEPGRSRSRTISMEEAFLLSSEAKLWLNPGGASTLDELRRMDPLFPSFLRGGTRVYNNIKRTTPGGGNDFWESGAARPDLVLADLAWIVSGVPLEGDGELCYYIPVE